MSTDDSMKYSELQFSTTYMKKEYNIQRPETATERLKRERLEKRRARAIKNGRKIL